MQDLQLIGSVHLGRKSCVLSDGALCYFKGRSPEFGYGID